MRRRILQSTLFVVAVTGLVLGIPLALTTWRVVEDITRAELVTRLEQVVARLDIAERQGASDLRAVSLVLPPRGQLRVDSRTHGHVVIGTDPGEAAVVESLPIGDGGHAMLAVPGDSMRSTQLQATALVALLVVLSLAAGSMVSTFTTRRLAGPLRDVADRAARLGAGDFRPTPRRHGIPELDRVADVLDASAKALAQMVQRERDLVGDVSHQLRSRLTALQLRLDELSAHPDPNAAAEAEAALEQAERLGAVLDDLLRAAELARAATAEPVEIDGLLTEVVGEWRAHSESQGRTLRLRVDGDLRARVTPGRLREVLGVLLDNAVRYGGDTVTLSARAGTRGREAMVLVEVTDTGQGIPESLVPYVFDRGVSGSSSTGVGLALARALVEADGGRLELSSANPPTFTVYLRVPRTEDVAEFPLPSSGSVR